MTRGDKICGVLFGALALFEMATEVGCWITGTESSHDHLARGVAFVALASHHLLGSRRK